MHDTAARRAQAGQATHRARIAKAATLLARERLADHRLELEERRASLHERQTALTRRPQPVRDA